MIHEGERENKVISAIFSEHLLNWYRANKRELPWRKNKDPYRIWVSEIMLQQTRVDAAIPYYERFMERFPTLESLADAPEEEVLKLWEGLGYYSRARNLHAAVREVREKYGGRVPDTPEELRKLKGIGPYTVGAILSIAYDRPEPAVDGNVMRVLARYFCLYDDVAKSATRSKMEHMVRELMPRGAPGDFTQAMMELGALICTPGTPHCLICPVMESCKGRLDGVEQELPVKSKAKPPRVENRLVALVTGENGRVLVRQRPQRGLLAGLWELPHVERPAEDEARDFLQESLRAAGVHVRAGEWFMHVEHTFSHIRWNMEVYVCNGSVAADGPSGESSEAAGAALPPGYRWMEESELDRYAFPKVFLRVLERYWGAGSE
jgi:A/G-specific adenine glycosylase